MPVHSPSLSLSFLLWGKTDLARENKSQQEAEELNCMAGSGMY